MGICGLIMVCIVLCYFEKLVGYDVILCIVCDLCVWFFCCVLLLVLVWLGVMCIGELLVCLLGDIGEVDGLLVWVIGLLVVLGVLLVVVVVLVVLILLLVVVLLVVLVLLIVFGVLWLGVCGYDEEEVDCVVYCVVLCIVVFEGLEGVGDLIVLYVDVVW